MSVTTPVVPTVHKMRSPNFPQFFFEWHVCTEKVYAGEIPGQWVDGVFVPDLSKFTAQAACVAEHCEHHARFIGFVQTWLRGYRKGKSDENVGGLHSG